MNLFDSHCHFNDVHFDSDRDTIIKNAFAKGVKHITVAGWDVESSKTAIELSKEYPFIYATAGISPNDVDDSCNIGELEKIIDTYSINKYYEKSDSLSTKNEQNVDKKVVAVGEIGLDYYWNKDNKDLQKELFIKQIELANKYDLPIQIHTRDAAVDTIQILKDYPVNKKGIFHCCPLNQELIKNAVSLGFYVSFSGNITFKNAKADPCIALVPIEQLLIETDSPYLTPEPNRGRRNDSSNVYYVAEKIATSKQMSIERIAEQTFDNACRIFNIH